MKSDRGRKMETGFKDWNIEKCIGEGAFGKVYKIVRKDFGHTYEAALKVIEIPRNQAEYEAVCNHGMSKEEVREYFKSMVEHIVEEFALMAKVKGNSNIVSYEDHAVMEKTDEFGWTIYIRMELLTPLYEHVKKEKMTVRDVVQMGMDLCKALEVCQKYHIIHRDIKPENIFVSDVGTYKLGDFGIARVLERNETDLSKKGTRSYMAPEVYKGEEYNASIDLYSLGLVLYRFLNNNRLPFWPDVSQVLKYGDKEKAESMRMSGLCFPKPANATEPLVEVILKACAYKAEDRFSCASEMRMELEAILAAEQEAAPSFVSITDKNCEYDDVSKNVLEDSYQSNAEDESTIYLFKKEPEQEVVSKVSPIEAEKDIIDSEYENQTGKEVLCQNGKKKKYMRFLFGGSICGILAILSIGMLFSQGSITEQKQTANIQPPTTATEQTTSEPTLEPTIVITEEPTVQPTVKATKEPEKSTEKPTKQPTKCPTKKPTEAPSITREPATEKPEPTKVYVYATSLSLPKNISIAIGKSMAVPVSVSPADAEITISSGNSDIVSISGRTMKAKNKGTCTITVKSGSKTATCRVMVTE